MAAILVPRRLAAQPADPGAVEVDWSHPLADGLVALLLPRHEGGPLVDVARLGLGEASTFGAAFGVGAGDSGIGRAYNGGGSQDIFPDPLGLTNNAAYHVYLRFRLSTLGDWQGLWTHNSSGTTAGYKLQRNGSTNVLRVEHSGQSVDLPGVTVSGLLDGQDHGLSVQYSSAGVKTFLDGRSQGTVAIGGGPGMGAGTFRVFSEGTDWTSGAPTGVVYAVAIHSRPLADTEAAEWHENSWQVLRTPGRRIYWSAGVPWTGSATALPESAASLSTAIRLAGASVAIAASQSHLATAVNFAAQTTAAPAAAADLTTAIRLSAAAVAAASIDAALSTSIRLASATAALPAALGDLFSRRPLTGRAFARPATSATLSVPPPMRRTARLYARANVSRLHARFIT